jgi:hypothetical protein
MLDIILMLQVKHTYRKCPFLPEAAGKCAPNGYRSSENIGDPPGKT